MLRNRGKQQIWRMGWVGTASLFWVTLLQSAQAHATYILADRYAALAWAEGYTNYSISSGYLSSAEAEQAALDACRQIVQKDCTIATSIKNGVIVYALADDGSRLAISGPNRALTRSGTLQKCMQQGRRCQIANESESRGFGKVVKAIPDDAAKPDLWGTVAWRADHFPGNVKRIWAVSQHLSQNDAIKAALQLCEREEKAECSAKAGVRNVFLSAYVYLDDFRTPLIESDVTPALTSQSIKRNCANVQFGCAELFTFDVRKPVKAGNEFDLSPVPTAPPPASKPTDRK